MKVYFIAVIMSWVVTGGGTSMQVMEMPDLATCEVLAEAIQTEEGWTASHFRDRYQFSIDSILTKCVSAAGSKG